MKNLNLNIGSFNIRGLNSNLRKQHLESDLKKYKLDIICLQETKIQDGIDININRSRLICFKSECRHYGNGFLVSESWTNSIHRTWQVNDRLCVIQFKSKNNKIISIINVYGPTLKISKENTDIRDKFYKDLEKTFKDVQKKSYITLIAGDFNSKVGKRIENKVNSDGIMECGETCLGRYSRGQRNENGTSLVDFCESNNLFIANSAFNHSARHQTTWIGQRRLDERIIPIFNQIDFIICKIKDKCVFTDARSNAGTSITSDHKLVIGKITIDWNKIYKIRKHPSNPKINIQKLTQEKDLRNNYQSELENLLNMQNNEESTDPQNNWDELKKNIKTAAMNSVGLVAPTKQHNRTPDNYIRELSVKQKHIRLEIQKTTDIAKREKLKRERNAINHNISKRALDIRNEELDQMAIEVESKSETTMMYSAVKVMNRKRLENPKVLDENGQLATTPDEILKITTSFFKEKLQNQNLQKIDSFRGPARQLHNEITTEEVHKNLNKLKNNRAAGSDEITGELLKYGAEKLSTPIAEILNEVFRTHKPMEINNGTMITLPKPLKPKGPTKNLRPVMLLDAIRKSISLIVLDRIRPRVEDFLSDSQSGFRPDRSTADIVWAHRWLVAKVIKSKMSIKITGIDMSAAFDTVNRQKLINILETILDEDELRIIQFLLSNTTISIRVNGATKPMPFVSNIGVPQGDGLSPVLFTIYLEAALREVRVDLNAENLPTELAYADDVDFVSETNHINVDNIQQKLSGFNLNVNTDKTELTILKRKESKVDEDWRLTKKVGSLLGDTEDIERRKALSNVALNKLFNIWIRKDKIKLKTRIRLYKTLVKSVLIYNCGTWGVTQAEEERLNAFHRKQLKRIMGIFYPTKISNKALYKKAGEKPLSDTMRRARWRLFGHILRRNSNIPANVAMQFYFKDQSSGFRGRPRTTLPVVLNKDLMKFQNHIKKKREYRSYRNLRLEKSEDLERIRLIAQDRDKWKKLIMIIEEAGEASMSEDTEAELH